MELFNYRKSYTKHKLSINDIGDNPIDFFVKWFKDAENSSQISEPNAMTISTVDENSFPSSRVVLLKQIKERSLIFFTNYNSNKGKSLEKNENICASFYWPSLERQVIIKGKAKKLPLVESEDYFNSRPRGSQISASVSLQSSELDSYESLEKRSREFEAEYLDKEIQRPTRWGGFLVKPKSIEFWIDQKNRLHKRELFTIDDSDWKMVLLSP